MDKNKRERVFACIVYPDSSPSDWVDRLRDSHVEALISPLHDKDVDSSGNPKKPHYHLMLRFPGKKSRDSVSSLLDSVLGSNRLKTFQSVGSTRGYARYLCHLDEPEDVPRYDPDSVVCLGGWSFAPYVSDARESVRLSLSDVYDLIDSEGIEYYSDLVKLVRKMDRPELFDLVSSRYYGPINGYITALRTQSYHRWARYHDSKVRALTGLKSDAKDLIDQITAMGVDSPGFVDNKAALIAARSLLADALTEDPDEAPFSDWEEK